MDYYSSIYVYAMFGRMNILNEEKGREFKMERGILFSKAEKPTREYCKAFCFADTPKSAFWDRKDPEETAQRPVTGKKARYYDEIMKKIILPQI